jgi:DNA-binding GntR family transcriptional regulator
MDRTVKHEQLHHIVAEGLRIAILDGELKPGEWLRQERIAEDFGVSAMPVREALKQLVAEGVVEHIPYRGSRVTRFTAQDVADLYANRSHLETMAAKAAARQITPEELAELRGLCTTMQAELDSNRLSEYSHLNRRFHRAIYRASHRDYLVRALDQIWSAFPTMMMSYYAQTASRTSAQREARDLDEHRAIIVALENGDGDEVERLMRQHIESNCDELLAALDTQD